MTRKRILAKKLWLLVLVFFLNVSLIYAQKVIRIGILSDGSFWNNEQIIQSIQKELQELVDQDWSIEYPVEAQIDGKYDTDRIEKSSKVLLSSNVDLILSLGTMSSREFAFTNPLPIPVVGVGVEFPFALGLLGSDLRPVNPNFTTSFDPSIANSVIQTTLDIYPHKRFTFLCSEILCGNLPFSGTNASTNTSFLGVLQPIGKDVSIHQWPKVFSKELGKLGEGQEYPIIRQLGDWYRISEGWVQKREVSPQFTENANTSVNVRAEAKGIETALQDLAKEYNLEANILVISPNNFSPLIQKMETDLVYVSNMYGFSSEEVERLFEQLNSQKFPTVTAQGLYAVDRGALMSVSDFDYQEIGRTFALKIHSILNGISPKNIRVIDDWKINLIFNMNVANQIGFDVPIEYLYEAQLIGEVQKTTKLSFVEAIQKALENDEILMDRELKKQTYIGIDTAVSNYLPQIKFNLVHNRADETRADISPSPRAETKAELELFQTIYNPVLLSVIDAADQGSLLAETTTKLVQRNVQQNVILAYFDYLQAQEAILIRKKHLRTYRKLKDLAQLRYSLQETGLSDVLRVDMQYEGARSDMTTALEQFQNARIRLNQQVNFPPSTSLALEKSPLEEVGSEQENNELLSRFRTIPEQQALGEYLTKEALDNSAEMQLIQQQIQLVSLEKKQARSEFYPQVTLGATYFQQLDSEHREFASKTEEKIYDNANQKGWNLQLKVTMPLYNGGSKFSELDRVDSRMMELQVQRNQTASTIASQTQLGLIHYFSNRTRLQNSFKMVEAARKNFELGKESYLQGAIPIMDLLDLQSNVILSELNVVSAQYEVFRSLTRLLASIGKIHFLSLPSNDPEIFEYIQEVEKYVQENS